MGDLGSGGGGGGGGVGWAAGSSSITLLGNIDCYGSETIKS